MGEREEMERGEREREVERESERMGGEGEEDLSDEPHVTGIALFKFLRMSTFSSLSSSVISRARMSSSCCTLSMLNSSLQRSRSLTRNDLPRDSWK